MFLQSYLTGLPEDGRLGLDGGVTTEPDSFELYRDDVARNYSATVGWLAQFRDLCRGATDGFTVG